MVNSRLKTCKNVQHFMVAEWQFFGPIEGDQQTVTLSTSWEKIQSHTTSSDVSVTLGGTLGGEMAGVNAETQASLHNEFTRSESKSATRSTEIQVSPKNGRFLWQWVYTQHAGSAHGPTVNTLFTSMYHCSNHGQDPPTCTPQTC